VSETEKTRVLLAAVGSGDRGDDGIGRRVIEQLASRLPAGARLADCGADPLALLALLGGCEMLLAIDAAACMGAPGRVHRIDLSDHDLPYGLLENSSHALGLAGAIALARALGMLPGLVIVYAVEGACFERGAPMSAAVAAVSETVASRILEELHRGLSRWVAPPRCARDGPPGAQRVPGAAR
jgi:hydrogenase maturation protease